MAKQFTASFSKLKNFETCPFKHLKVDLTKPKDGGYSESSEQLEWGNKVHTAFENAFKHNRPMPEDMKPWEKWVTVAKRLPGEHLVEQKWGLTRDFKPTEYFGPRVYWRGRGDFVALQDTTAAILDWKTGQMKHDSDQLVLCALCLFAYHPKLERIRCTFVWLPDDTPSSDTYDRNDVANALKSGLLDRINALEHAAINQIYPKRPSGLCVNWCPVDICEFHRKGSPR